MKEQQTITLWNVGIPQAKGLREIIKADIQKAIIDNDFETASELLYQIKDITSKINHVEECEKLNDESEVENDD